MKLKSSQRKSIAAIPTAFKGQERRYAQSVSENLDTLSGRRGNIIDRAVTFRDLLDSGVLRLAGGILSDGGIDVTNPNDPDSDPNGPIELPTKPTNLVASGGFNVISLNWELAPYSGHDYVEIFRFQSDSLSSAEAAGAYVRYYGDAYFYFDQNVGSQETWYYWVRAVNKSGVAGPFNQLNGTSATTALDYVYISGLIDDIIADDINDLGLNTKIDLIDANIVEVENSIAVINSEIDALNSINAWSSTTAYAVADLVTYSNKIWEATLASTNQAPSASSTYWTLVGNYNNLVDFVSATQSQNSSTRATLTSDYYTITDANSAISTATTGLASTTSVNTALGNYTTTSNLNQNFYTKTATDSAITTATTGLASTTSVNTALGNYTTTSSLNQNFYTKAGADSAISSATNGLASTTYVNNQLGNYVTSANLTQNYYTKTAADSAISTGISNFTTTVNGQTSTIQQVHESTNGNASKYAVKIDNNGHISGFGLVSKPNNDPAQGFSYPYGTSSFVIAADRFSVSAPYNANSTTLSNVPTKSMFKVITTQTTILGQTVPSGVYIDDAFIHNAQITNAKIGDAQITSAKIVDLTADKITSGEIVLDSYNNNAIRLGKLTYYGPADGFWLGNLNGKGAFNIGNATEYLKFNGTTLAITGASINTASIGTLQLAGNSVTVPEGDSASISVNCGNSYVFLDSQLNYLSTWDANSVPSGIIIGAMVQYVGANTSNQASGNATAYVKMTIEWRNSSGVYSLNTSDGDKTIGVNSLRKTFGGAAVSTTFLTPPSGSRGLRVRIQGRNQHVSEGNAFRKASKYGYFVLAAKR